MKPLDRKIAQPQRRRANANCTGCGPCFYCDTELDGPHDHDHFPLPWAHGGRDVVPACIRCHRLKHGPSIDKWPPAAQTAAGEGMTTAAAIALELANGALEEGLSHDYEHRHELAELMLPIVADCTTAEARIAVAQALGTYLDVMRKQLTS